MTNTPKLRFKEFSGEWKSKKFKDIVWINQGLQIAISDRYLEDGENRFFYITNEFLNKNSDKKYYIENPPSNVICKKTDILMTRTGNTGRVITGVSGAFHNNFFKINYDSKQHNQMFLYHVLTSFKVQKNITRLAGTSTIPDLNHGDFYNIKISYPTLEEQEKIASFFSLIDKKIELQTEKVEELKNYKKGIMQKIFSQQLRFKDENGNEYPEWEEKSLACFLSESRIKGDTGDQAKKLTVKLWAKGIVEKRDDFQGSTETQYYIRKAGQLMYGKLDFLNCAFGIVPTELDGFQSTLDAPAFDVRNANSIFLLNRIIQKDFYKKNGDIADGSRKAKRIHVDTFLDMKTFMPTLEEQDKIASFFSLIDKKIDIEVDKLEQLRLQKKGFLQQMFI